MFNLIGVGEHAGSGVPDILAAWDEEGYDMPTVEERFGADAPDRTTLTLPLVASLGTSLTTGEHAGEHADKLDAVVGFCEEPRTRSRPLSRLPERRSSQATGCTVESLPCASLPSDRILLAKSNPTGKRRRTAPRGAVRLEPA